MNSILTVTTPATLTDLTDLATVKAELGITGGADDAKLTRAIDEVSSIIASHCDRVFARESMSEIFTLPCAVGPLRLDRWPVTAIASITENGTALAAADYEVDAATGRLYRRAVSGDRTCWRAGRIVVAYTGGYLMPGDGGRNLPNAIESAAIELVTAAWASKGRDPLVKAEDVPGLGRVEFWVGATSAESNELPPSVAMKLAPFRRMSA